MEKPHVSFAKAIGDVTIENFSEVTGPALSAMTSKLVPKAFTAAMTKLWKKLHPTESIKKLATSAGYNGFLEELGEERVGALLRATFGVDDFGAEDPDKISGGPLAQEGSSRGFFTNSQVGQLGSVNQAVNPSTLAVFGILITLLATSLQLLKGD